MKLLALAVTLVACGTDVAAPPQASLPPRVRLLTDSQYANAVRDLLGVEAAIHTPGTRPHQFIHEDRELAVDAPLLVQYRIAAEDIAKRVGPVDIETFATRAFRRPLAADELAALRAMDPRLAIETVLQSPSFIYRTEIGPTPYELASELSFLFLDSIPDEPLWQAARDGTLADAAVVEAQVDRLLALPRVRAHLTDVVMDWLDLHDIETIPRVLRASMYEQVRRFVDDVLWNRDGSLRELLASNRTFVDGELAGYYNQHPTTWSMQLVDTDRTGILTHPGVLSMLSKPTYESIIMRGIYVNRKFLCTEELGRPPFAAIQDTAHFTEGFSEAQLAHFRAAHVYCSKCHRQIDPPGLLLHQYDGWGTFRFADPNEQPIDTDIVMTIDGVARHLNNATDLGNALADSEQVAHCVVDQLAHHALGRAVDGPLRGYLYRQFERSDHDIVDVFRSIATSSIMRSRTARQASQ